MAVEGASGLDVLLSFGIIGVFIAGLVAVMVYSARQAKIGRMEDRMRTFVCTSEDREVLNVSAPRIQQKGERES